MATMAEGQHGDEDPAQHDGSPGPEPLTGTRLTVGYLGIMAIIIGVMTLLPLLILPFYPSETPYAACFLVPGVCAIICGNLMRLAIRGRRLGRLHKGQDAVVIVFTWLLAMNVCAVPFMMSGICDFTQSVFETMSGLSTTTLTMVDVSAVPHLILMFRSILLFFGGVGLVLIMVSAVSDSHSLRIYNAEGHTDRLLPNMAQSARLILSVYCMFVIVGTVILTAVGMPVFDSLNHAIAAISTGGFSTQTASIGAYDSPVIELVLEILMILGGTNCALNLLLLKRDFRAYLRDGETRMYLGAIVVGTVLVGVVLFAQGVYQTLPESLRYALFQVVSAVTTTGFQTTSSLVGWPAAAGLVLTILMVFGAETDSTGGGIKQWRAFVLVKMIGWTVRDRLTHRRVVKSDMVDRLGKRVDIGPSERQEILVYGLVYLIVLVAAAMIYCLYGFSVGSSLFESASALSTVGFSMGIATPGANPVILWTAIAEMFLGRLEVYPVLIAVARAKRLVDGRAR